MNFNLFFVRASSFDFVSFRLVVLYRSCRCVGVYVVDFMHSLENEFCHSIRSNFTNIHCRSVRTNSNSVRIIKVSPMIDYLFGVRINCKPSDGNHWRRWSIHSINIIACKSNSLILWIRWWVSTNWDYRVLRHQKLFPNLVLAQLRPVCLHHVSFSVQRCRSKTQNMNKTNQRVNWLWALN